MPREHLTPAHPTTPREFYDEVMENAEQNPPFTALNFKDDVGRAYNFFMGYVEHLSEQEDMKGKDPYRVAEANIRWVAGYCISGVVRDGKTPSEQFTEVLGIWPGVFEAVQVQLEGRAVLEQVN